MKKFKIRKSKRIIRQTTNGGLAIINQQFAKYSPFVSMSGALIKKKFGITILSVWLVMIYRALLGGSSLNQFQKDWNKDSAKGFLVRYRKVITNRLLARNIIRNPRNFVRKMVTGTAIKLYREGLLSLKNLATDSTEILISGSKYPKVGSIKKNGKYLTGYKLSILFDVDAKIPVAYIITSLNVHDSQLLIPLLKMFESEFGRYPTNLAIDRGYYGIDFFKFLDQVGIKFFIPAKYLADYKNRVALLAKGYFHYNTKFKVHYYDDCLELKDYGYLRCVFVFSKGFEEWMPSDEKNKDMWAILTNDINKSPLKVIQTYKNRWQIEVFFKAIKQQLGLEKLPGRDYRIIQMHIATILLSYILITSLVLEERFNDEIIPITLKEWVNTYVNITLTVSLKGNYVFLEFQEKWVELDPMIIKFLNGGIFM